MVENFENMPKEKLVFLLKEYQNKVQSLQTEVDTDLALVHIRSLLFKYLLAPCFDAYNASLILDE